MTIPIRSSDTMAGPTIRRMRGKVLDVHAEHWWYRSSRCAGGDCVEVAKAGAVILVQDSKLPATSGGSMQAWSLEEWTSLLAAVREAGRESQPRHVALDFPEAAMEPLIFGLDRHEKLFFDFLEWRAFREGVLAGEFEPEKLSEPPNSPAGRDLQEDAEVSSGAIATTGQPGPSSEVPNQEDPPLISWSEDPSLGEPQGPSKGAARRAGQGPDLADRSSTEAAGTGALPPPLVPVADREQLPGFVGEALDIFRDAYDDHGLYAAATLVAQWAYQAGWSDHEEWAKASAPLVATDGAS